MRARPTAPRLGARRTSRTGHFCASLLIFGALAACGGSNGEGGGSAQPQHVVWIDATETETTRAFIDLYGGASCDACPPSVQQFGSCAPIAGPFDSAIDITWLDRTTGETGVAPHAIYGRATWFFSYCFVSYSHRWSARIPLAFGVNEIEFAATGPGAEPGSDTLTVLRRPLAPAGLATESERGAVVLTWEPAPGADSYTLVWSDARDLTLPGSQVVPGAQSPFVHAGLADNVPHYYAVRALANGVESALSPVVLGTAGWPRTTLPAPAFAWQAADIALALAPDGSAHVHVSRLATSASWRIANDYLTDADGAWSSVPVAEVGDLGAGLALDALGRAHVTYTEVGGSGRHAVRNAGTWTAETFAFPASCATSLALDRSGAAHVLFTEQVVAPVTSGRVRSTTNASGVWASEIVGTTEFGCRQEGAQLALAFGAFGDAHALFLGAPPELGVLHATDAAGAWEVELVTPGFVRTLAQAVDARGVVYAAWTDANSVLHCARRERDGWTAEDVDTFAYGVSLAAAEDGRVWLGYVNYAFDELRCAVHENGAWRVIPVTRAQPVDTAVAVDGQGRVRIVFGDAGELATVTNR